MTRIGHQGAAFFDRDIRRNEIDRIDADRQFGILRTGQNELEVLRDCISANDPLELAWDLASESSAKKIVAQKRPNKLAFSIETPICPEPKPAESVQMTAIFGPSPAPP